MRSYTLRDRHLFLSLMADGGTYEFEPLGEARRAVQGPTAQDTDFAYTNAYPELPAPLVREAWDWTKGRKLI